MNNIIEQTYKEIKEKIIDIEFTTSSELFEQVTSNNIDNVNKGLSIEPECIKEAT